VAFLEPARDVRLGVEAEPTEGDRHDREAGQAVGVEVPEHEHPLRCGAGGNEPLQEPIGVGQEPRIVQAVLRGGKERIELTGIADAPRGEQLEHASGDAVPGACRTELVVHDGRDRELPTVTRLQHGAQDATRHFIADQPGISKVI
jgi:hypothetical protein